MRRIPANILFLGLVSFFTDLSSEMVIPVILPLYMNAILPAAIALPAIGLIEGVAQSSASLLKLVSGWVSDKVGRRKALVVLGYGVSAVTKPLFAGASAWPHFLFIRFAERVGKGLRSAPRDALLAASVDVTARGTSFGFHRAMDTAGAFFGLVAALILVEVLRLEPHTFAPLFLISFIPALVAVIILAAFVREMPAPKTPVNAETASSPPFTAQFKFYMLILGIFALGNSSDAFLALRANQVGCPTSEILLLMILMNAVSAALSTWFGGLSDRIGRRSVIVGAFALYSLVYFGIGAVTARWQLWPLLAMYGIYYAMSEGTLRAMVADLVQPDARGRGYGMFHMVVGLMAVPSSLIMGLLWKTAGAQLAFSFGAALALIAALLLLAVRVPPVNSVQLPA